MQQKNEWESKYLRTNKGISGIPLQYTICINEEPGQAGMSHATVNESFDVTNVLKGNTLEVNKAKVWSVSKDLILKGSA